MKILCRWLILALGMTQGCGFHAENPEHMVVLSSPNGESFRSVFGAETLDLDDASQYIEGIGLRPGIGHAALKKSCSGHGQSFLYQD